MNNKEMKSAQRQAEDLAEALRAVGADQAEFALVLGSGLGGFADRLEDAVAIPYAQILRCRDRHAAR